MADDAEYWGRGSFTPFVLARDGCGAPRLQLLGRGGRFRVRARAVRRRRARPRGGAARARALFGASFALALGLASLVLCEIGGVLHPLSRWACWEGLLALSCVSQLLLTPLALISTVLSELAGLRARRARVLAPLPRSRTGRAWRD